MPIGREIQDRGRSRIPQVNKHATLGRIAFEWQVLHYPGAEPLRVATMKIQLGSST
jgi:hypothetical protein